MPTITPEQLELATAVDRRVSWAHSPKDNGGHGLDYLTSNGPVLRFWREDLEANAWQIFVFNHPRIRLVQAEARVVGVTADALATIADAMLRDLSKGR